MNVIRLSVLRTGRLYPLPHRKYTWYSFLLEAEVKEAVGNLNEVKPYDRVVKCSWVKFKWEEVMCRQV